jgi:hypothetical protein
MSGFGAKTDLTAWEFDLERTRKRKSFPTLSVGGHVNVHRFQRLAKTMKRK